MEIVWIKETASTNNEVLNYGPATEKGIILATHTQTRGRGQKGNSWESEPGKNLSFSAMWKPIEFPARKQFSISEAVALSVVDLLKDLGIEAKVKWPNDIYVGEKKICGILIEHSVMGMNLNRTIAGVGININQKEFKSDAPNPVSAYQLAGKEYDIAWLLNRYENYLSGNLEEIQSEEGKEWMHNRFMDNLWRGDGEAYPFRDVKTGVRYMGRIEDISPIGFLYVRNIETGEGKEYAFKEVEFLLEGGN